MKKLYSLLLIAALCLLSQASLAQRSVPIDGIDYFLDIPEIGKATVASRGNGGYSGDIVIPETIIVPVSSNQTRTYTVTAIGDNAFFQCKQLTSVSIPSTVETLGDKAFFQCTGIITIRCDALTPPDILQGSTFHKMEAERVTLIVPGQSIALYSAHPYWGKFVYNPADDSLTGNDNNESGSVIVTKTNYQILDNQETFFEKPIRIAGNETYHPTYNEYNMVSYKRNFKNTNWQALYVPIELVYNDWKEKFEIAKINDILEYETNFYAMADIVTDKVEPHVLYLIRAKEIGEHIINVSSLSRIDTDKDSLYRVYTSSLDTLALKPDIATKDIITTANGNSYAFTAQYAKGYIKENDHTQPPYRYAMTGGELKRPNPAMTDGIPLGAFRWWLEVTPSANSALSFFSLGKINHSGNNETSTGDTLIDLNEIEGIDIYYDLNGRRVDYPQKGIYILNGKKVYIK